MAEEIVGEVNSTVTETAPADSGHVEPAATGTETPTEPAEEMIPISRYKSLQAQWTKDHGELLNLKKATPPPVEPTADPFEARIAPLEQKLATYEMQASLDKLRASNVDTYDAVAPTLMAVFEENPALWQAKDPVAMAFEIAEARHIKANLPTLIQRATAQKEKDASAKQAGSDARTRSSSPVSQTPAEDDAGSRIVSAGRGHGTIFG